MKEEYRQRFIGYSRSRAVDPIIYKGQPVQITRLQLKAIKVLIQKYPDPVMRDDFFYATWGKVYWHFPNALNSVKSVIFSLNRLLGDDNSIIIVGENCFALNVNPNEFDFGENNA